MDKLTEKLKSEKAIVDLDGFDGHTDECAYENEEQDQDRFTSARVIEGDRISFTKAGTWVNTNTKQPLPTDLLLIVANVKRVVQK